MHEAYEAKKWGFVPDYARLDIVYEYGGIYLDTDVEIIKNLDELLEQSAFVGFEETGEGTYFVNCGQGFGAIPHHEIIREVRDMYDHLSFQKEDGTLNLLPSPHYTTKALKYFGLQQKNEEQKMKDMVIYPSEVLCPKNFTTGKLKITKKTVSIHHFTASWMEEDIKKELEYQRRMKKTYGEYLGKKLMYGKSILEKYKEKYKRQWGHMLDVMEYIWKLQRAKGMRIGTKEAVFLDTALNGDNTGDAIIMESCEKELGEVMKIERMLHVPTHRLIRKDEREILFHAPLKILCGTNILSGHMYSYGLWKIGKEIAPYKNTVLMGIGAASYDQSFDWKTKQFFLAILSPHYQHSVRDLEAEKLLHRMGIQNVLYTACPTMWKLTKEHCARIPKEKGTKVLCTITDYAKDTVRDRQMIDILKECYDEIYLWIQGDGDLEYVKTLNLMDGIQIVPRRLEELDRILSMKGLDYVGTRLHAGIRALNFGHRSIVIAIDNRATSISKDTGLPIVQREEISTSLKNQIFSSFETRILLPEENIKKWKSQFQGMEGA